MARAAPRRSALLLLLLLSCGSNREFVALDDAQAETFLLAHRASVGVPWTIQIGGPSDRPVLEVDYGDEIRLHLYDDSREALGLIDGAESRCKVLKPRDAFVLVDRDGEVSFVEDGVNAELAAQLVGDAFRCDPCAPLQGTPVLGTIFGRYTGAAWMDDDHVLLASVDGLAIATRTEVSPPVPCTALLEAVWSISNAGPGLFWTGGYERELALVRVSPDGQTCEVETSTLAPAWADSSRQWRHFAQLAPDPTDPARHDLVAVRTTGEVFRWNASALTRIGQMQDHPLIDVQYFSSVIRPDADTILTAHGWTRVHVFGPEGEARVEQVDIPPESIATRPRDRITALSFDPNRERFLLGTSYGDVWSRPRAGGAWSRLVQSPVSETVGALWTSARRQVIVHEGGDLGFLHHELGSCETLGRVPQATRSGTMRVKLERDGWLFLADVAGATGIEGTVVWLREPN